jgi:hypothetical protein
MTHAFHHIHIKSTDPQGTARFWAEAFGAKLLPERTISGALFAPVELGGTLLNISSPLPEERDRMQEAHAGLRYGLEHVALTTHDLERDLGRLREQGHEVFEVRETPEARIAFVSTPGEVRLELIEILR